MLIKKISIIFILSLFFSVCLAVKSNKFTMYSESMKKVTIDIKAHAINKESDYKGLAETSLSPFNGFMNFNLQANRHNHAGPAKSFNKWATINLHHDKGSKPGKLNFAFLADITFDTVTVADFAIGQGHHATNNDWWYGSNTCVFKRVTDHSSGLVNGLICPTDKPNTKILFQMEWQTGNKNYDRTDVYALRLATCPSKITSKNVKEVLINNVPTCKISVSTTEHKLTTSVTTTRDFISYKYDVGIGGCAALYDYSFVRAENLTQSDTIASSCIYSNTDDSESEEVYFTAVNSKLPAEVSSLTEWKNTTPILQKCSPQAYSKVGPQYCPFSTFVSYPTGAL